MTTEVKRAWGRSAACMLAMGAIFYTTYGFANWAGSQRAFVPSVVFAWEHHIPFLAWTIVPYWSLNLFYCLSFFLCRTRPELAVHTKRLLLVQAISVSIFLIAPLRFSFARPVPTGLIGSLFTTLEGIDRPFNQAPSLHLSLAVLLGVFYAKRLTGAARAALLAWFGLIGVSALTTFQHHFIDIPAGIWLGLFCAMSSSRLAQIYVAGAGLLTAAAMVVGGWVLWPAIACLTVSLIYWQGDPAWFRKRDGRISGLMFWLLAPYLGVAWLNSRLRRGRVAGEISEGVWVGRVPSRREREELGIRSIVDLTAELHVDHRGVKYVNIPMLDLAVPRKEQLDDAVAAIDGFAHSRPTLVCCALGCSRSVAAVEAWLAASGKRTSVEDHWPRAVLTPRHRAELESWARQRGYV